jgi:hypothetical protein
MLLMLGFFIGNLIFSAIIHWVGLVAEVLKSSAQGWRMAVAVSLFSSGPWTLLVAVVFAYFVHSEPWAPWLFAGVIVALAFFGSFAIVILKNQKRREAERAKNAA